MTLDDDFELAPVGQPALMFHCETNAGGSVLVSDDNAAGGRHSLKFTEGAGGVPWVPYVYMDAFYTRGILRSTFDLRVESGAQVLVEWRDWPSIGDDHYRAGPSLTVAPDGTLVAGGEKRLVLPPGQWVHFAITCPLGANINVWQLAVTLPGATQPQVFDRLPVQAGFKAVNWFGVCSFGAEGTIFHIDNLKLARQDD